MLFTFIVAGATTQALGLRPAYSASARTAHFAKLRDLAQFASANPSKSLPTLHEVTDVVNAIMLQEGNATGHLTDSDQQLLREVIEMINNSLYASMTESHQADEAALAYAIDAINQCQLDFTRRLEEGDLYHLHGQAVTYQNHLDELQIEVDEKRLLNATAWSNLETHMRLISNAPSCPAFPNPRTMASLDIYFESSAYVTWWTAQKAAYEPVRDAYLYANQQLEAALAAFAVGLGVRDVAYCDWKRELVAACAQYSTCYETAKAEYLNVVKPAVEEDMRARIEAYKAGETIIHQIKFLLAEESNQQTPSISTSRYQIAFPAVPAKQACDFSALDDARWVPTPDCHDAAAPWNIDTHVTIVPYFTVPDGKMEEFKANFPTFYANTKAGTTECLYYGFTIHGNKVFCREGYKSAAGALAHIDDVGTALNEAVAMVGEGGLDLSVMGPASELDKMREALTPLGTRFWELDSNSIWRGHEADVSDTHVTIVPYFTVPDGRMGEFKQNFPQFYAGTKAGTNEALYYGFAVHDNQVFCREGYESAEGVLAHLDDVGGPLNAALAIVGDGGLDLSVMGPAAELDKLREALTPLGTKFWELDSRAFWK